MPGKAPLAIEEDSGKVNGTEGLLYSLNTAPMPELTSEQLAHLRRSAPAFVQSVDQAVANKENRSTPRKTDAITTRLTDFPAGDMFTVYSGLLYARSKKVAVTVLP